MERFAGDNPQLSNLDLALSNSPKDPQDRFDPYAQNASTVQYGDIQRAPIPSQNPNQSEFAAGIQTTADNGSQSVVNDNQLPESIPAKRMTASERLASMYKAARETGDRKRAENQPKQESGETRETPESSRANQDLAGVRGAINYFDEARNQKKAELTEGSNNKTPEKEEADNDKQKEALERAQTQKATKKEEPVSDQPSWDRKKNKNEIDELEPSSFGSVIFQSM